MGGNATRAGPGEHQRDDTTILDQSLKDLREKRKRKFGEVESACEDEGTQPKKISAHRLREAG